MVSRAMAARIDKLPAGQLTSAQPFHRPSSRSGAQVAPESAPTSVTWTVYSAFRFGRLAANGQDDSRWFISAKRAWTFV